MASQQLNEFFNLIANKSLTITQLEDAWKNTNKKLSNDKTEKDMMSWFEHLLKNYEGEKSFVKTTSDLFDFMGMRYPLSSLKELSALQKYDDFKQWVKVQEEDEIRFVNWMRNLDKPAHKEEVSEEIKNNNERTGIKKIFKKNERCKTNKPNTYQYPFIVDGYTYYFLYPVKENTRSHLNMMATYLNISYKNKYKVDLLDEILDAIEIENVSFEELVQSRY